MPPMIDSSDSSYDALRETLPDEVRAAIEHSVTRLRPLSESALNLQNRTHVVVET